MPRRQLECALLASSMLLAACGGSGTIPDSATVRMGRADGGPAAIFEPAIAEIRDSVHMPILLPATLPATLRDPGIDEARGLVRPDGYGVELRYGETPGDAGSAAFFSGSTHVFHLVDDPAAHPLALANGVQGIFRAVSCGASCSGPFLSWEQEGVMYTIEIDLPSTSPVADQERVLLEAANAMVRVGHPVAERSVR